MSAFRFTLRMNNAATNDPCAICGRRTDPECGVELFFATPRGPRLVYDACGARLVPYLHTLREVTRKQAWKQERQARS